MKIQYNRNRYYDSYTGQWLTHDPLGIVPDAHNSNDFRPVGRYVDTLNLYEYGKGNPIKYVDASGYEACGELTTSEDPLPISDDKCMHRPYRWTTPNWYYDGQAVAKDKEGEG